MFKKLFKGSRKTYDIIEIEGNKLENSAQNIVLENRETFTDNTEIVAIITACIAQGLNVNVDKLIVHSIKKVPQWVLSGRLIEK